MGLHFAEMQTLLVSLHQAPTPASDSQAQKTKVPAPDKYASSSPQPHQSTNDIRSTMIKISFCPVKQVSK